MGTRVYHNPLRTHVIRQGRTGTKTEALWTCAKLEDSIWSGARAMTMSTPCASWLPLPPRNAFNQDSSTTDHDQDRHCVATATQIHAVIPHSVADFKCATVSTHACAHDFPCSEETRNAGNEETRNTGNSVNLVMNIPIVFIIFPW